MTIALRNWELYIETLTKLARNATLQINYLESGLVKDWSDPDTDDEMNMFQGHDPSDRQKYKWPLPNTTNKARIEKEKQLHILMTEIGRV